MVFSFANERPVKPRQREFPVCTLSIRKRVKQLIAIVLSSCALSQLATAQNKPPIEAFFDRPSFTQPKLSPDGRRIAFLTGSKTTRMRLAVLDLATMKPTMVAGYQDADVHHFDWANGQRLVYDLSIDLTGPGVTNRGPGLFAVNADGSEGRAMVETSMAFVQDGDRPELLPWYTRLHSVAGRRDSGDIFVERPENVSKRDVGFFTLSRVETRRGRASPVETPPHSRAFWIDKTGQLKLVMTTKDNQRELLWRDAKGGWKSLEKTERFAFDGFQPLTIGPDGTLYGLSAQDGKQVLYTYDPEKGQRAAKPLLAAPGFDVAPTLLFTHSKLLGVRTTVDSEVTHWLDPETKALQDQVDKRLPETANRLSIPYRAETPWVVVQASSDRQPTISYALNTETKQLVSLGQEHPAIRPAQMGTTDFVRFKARDGLEIPLYFTLPPGERKTGLPVVVLVHGGPYVRGASWGWDAEVQFLASRGYAVLQPEFRGSTGYGNKLFEAGWKQWGLGMQTDLADAVKWAVAQGFADPKRVCIAGASYGGYAALMGLVNDPDVYRCAVNWVGVSDIQMLYDIGWSDISSVWQQYGMPQLVGDREKDAAQLRSTSPLQQAARITKPVLMAYGGFDARVPIVHGEKMRDALKAHNTNVEWVVYRTEGHGWRSPETRFDFWRKVEAFLAKHLSEP
jgi:dipeptidyl aminopeptidase/acylaminoacyl peptidase